MGRSGGARIDEARIVNRFVMTVLIPIMMTGLMANTPIARLPLVPVLTYAAAQALLFVAGYLLARRLLRRDAGEAVLLATCGIFGNNVFYVLPIARLLYPGDPLLAVAAVILLESVVIFAGAMAALEILALGRTTPTAALAQLARSPILWSIALGIALSLAGVVIPAPLQTFIGFNAAAAAPAALWALGVVLSGTPLRPDATAVSFALIKMAAMPMIVAAGLHLGAPDSAERSLFLLSAAAPAGVMAFSLALLYGIRTEAIAQVIVWTSLLTLFTLAALA